LKRPKPRQRALKEQALRAFGHCASKRENIAPEP
jgi:hypothetical protein